MALPTFKKNKLWIWKAYYVDTRQPIDWKYGNRDTNTLKKLLKRLKRWNVKIYVTDQWKPYAEVIPEEFLLQSKKQTHPIERHNFRQRHWSARFRRKTCVVSRSLQMVDLIMALFAKFHCNSSFSFPSLFT